jgi:hypothetical protein
MCSIDYDVASVYSETDRIARKEHICCECSRIIEKKEKYRHVFGVWVGKVSIFKTCSNCLKPQEWLKKECGGFLHGNLEDEIFEHASEYRKIFLYRWLIGIRKKWKLQVHLGL